MTVFAGHEERLDHLGLDEVAAEGVQLGKPELVATVVAVGSIGRVVAQLARNISESDLGCSGLRGQACYKFPRCSVSMTAHFFTSSSALLALVLASRIPGLSYVGLKEIC